MTVLENVLQKLGEHNTAMEVDYDSLVTAIADCSEPAAIRVAKVLALAGKSEETLQADVLRLIERRRLRVAMDAKPVAEKQVTVIETALRKIEAKRDAFDKKCDDERWPLDIEREQLQVVVAAADDAQRELYGNCADPEIFSRSAQNYKDLEAISAKMKERQSYRDQCSAAGVDAHKIAIGVMEPDGRRAYAKQDAEDYSRRCVTLDSQIAELKVEQGKLMAERDELDSRRLEP